MAYAVPCGVSYKFGHSDVCIALTVGETLPFIQMASTANGNEAVVELDDSERCG